MSPLLRIVSILLSIVIGVALFFHSQSYLSSYKKKNPVSEEADLYIPELPYLKLFSLGHDTLIADLILAKALVYYGSHYKERHKFGFRHLKKLFFTAAGMDPLNRDVFIMGNNVLKTTDPSGKTSIELLKRGLETHKNYWKFYEMIGFNYYYNQDDPEKAGIYYEKAAKLPGPAPYVSSLSGKFYEESGKYREAIRVLKRFYENTTDKRLKKNFKESIEQILERIKSRDRYFSRNIESIVEIIKIRLGGI